jgi:hypothetical protein
MNADFKPQYSNQVMIYHEERRCKPRVNCSYPAVVRAERSNGIHHETPAVLSNMSASGMYLRLNCCIAPGSPVNLKVRLSTAPLGESNPPIIAASGKVVRSELLKDGTYGIGIQLNRYRFL